MTFSQNVKGEILGRLSDSLPCCRLACLSALLRGAGSLEIRSGSLGCSLTSENKRLLEFAVEIVYSLYGLKTEIRREETKIKGNSLWSVFIAEEKTLSDCGLASLSMEGYLKINEGIDKYIVEQDCCKNSYVAALFAACGSVAFSPLKTLDQRGGNRFGYHFEFSLTSRRAADDLVCLLEEKGFRFKIAERKNVWAVYIKDSASICDMLAYMGADKAVLTLNNLLIEREIRNNANRQKNCITANIDKSVDASEKHIAAINKIRAREGMFDRLAPHLKEIAAARVENPFSTLDELADKLGLTKSCVNHRLRKITEIASRLP